MSCGKLYTSKHRSSAADRLQELNEQLGRAEKLRQKKEQASAAARKEITDHSLTEIEGLDEDIRVIKRTRDLEAATITMQYAAGRQDGVSIDGAVLLDRESMPIPDGAELDMEGPRPVGHPPRQKSRR